jgi:hypothetical protein
MNTWLCCIFVCVCSSLFFSVEPLCMCEWPWVCVNYIRAPSRTKMYKNHWVAFVGKTRVKQGNRSCRVQLFSLFIAQADLSKVYVISANISKQTHFEAHRLFRELKITKKQFESLHKNIPVRFSRATGSVGFCACHRLSYSLTPSLPKPRNLQLVFCSFWTCFRCFSKQYWWDLSVCYDIRKPFFFQWDSAGSQLIMFGEFAGLPTFAKTTLAFEYLSVNKSPFSLASLHFESCREQFGPYVADLDFDTRPHTK